MLLIGLIIMFGLVGGVLGACGVVYNQCGCPVSCGNPDETVHDSMVGSCIGIKCKVAPDCSSVCNQNNPVANPIPPLDKCIGTWLAPIYPECYGNIINPIKKPGPIVGPPSQGGAGWGGIFPIGCDNPMFKLFCGDDGPIVAPIVPPNQPIARDGGDEEGGPGWGAGGGDGVGDDGGNFNVPPEDVGDDEDGDSETGDGYGLLASPPYESEENWFIGLIKKIFG